MTMKKIRNVLAVAAVLCTLAGEVGAYELTHRWSFNGSYADSVAGGSATVVGDAANLNLDDGKTVTMTSTGDAGGSLDLGIGVCGTGDATIEIWARQNAARNWARVLDYGKDTDAYFLVAWSQGEDITNDRVELRNKFNRDRTMSPHVLGRFYHFFITFKVVDGSTTIRWTCQDVESGVISTFSQTVENWTLADLSDPHFYLGHSQFGGDRDANASYDEVRIYSGVVSDDQLLANTVLGPDALASTIGAETGMTIPAGATFTVGASGAYVAAGTVTLGAGAKIRFDTAAFPGARMEFVSGGFFLPSGGESVLDCVELTDAENYEKTLDGNTIVVSKKTTVPGTATWIGGTPSAAADFANPANWLCNDAYGTTIEGAVPGPATTVIIPGGDTAFTIPAGTTPNWGALQLGAEGSATLWGRIAYDNGRGNMTDFNWRTLGLVTYELQGEGSVGNLARGTDAGDAPESMRMAQLRYDGWFHVGADQAGVWRLYQFVDDYFAFAIDGVWLIANNSYNYTTEAIASVAAGWHRYTLITGDTGGGFGARYEIGDMKVPLAVSVNGAAEAAFSPLNFDIGSTSAAVVTLTADCDWVALGPITLSNGTILDLNGHSLVVQDITADHVGAQVVNSSQNDASLIFIVDPETSDSKHNLRIAENVKRVMEVAGAATAVWTGEAGDGDALNAANWICYSSRDMVLADTLPTSSTSVTIQGDKVNMQAPVGTAFTCRTLKIGACTFTADCDWRGLPFAPAVIGAVDLAGKSLQINDGFTAEGDGAAFVNSNEEAVSEIGITAAADAPTAMASRIVGNNIKIVKTGEGAVNDDYLTLGDSGEGEFLQKEGAVAFTGSTVNRIGGYAQDNRGHGVYTMEGGTLTATAEFTVGAHGTGEFIQTNGTVTLSNWFNIGRFGGTGTYSISGGELISAYNNLGIIGASGGTGTLDISGTGRVTLPQPSIGNGWGGNNSKGFVTVSDQGTLASSGNINVGHHGGCTGTFTFNNGLVTANDVIVGAEGTGYFVQNGGTVKPTYWEYVGSASTGFYTQNGGKNLVTGMNNNCLMIGNNANGTGTYTLNDGELEVQSNWQVGVNGKGYFFQNGGTASCGGWFALGRWGSGVGNYTMTGGTYTSVNNPFIVAEAGKGTLDVSGTGVMNLPHGMSVGHGNASAIGEVRLREGGKIVTSSVYHNGDGLSYLWGDGGTIQATGDGNILSGLGSIALGAGGLVLDTAGHNVSIVNCGMAPSGGGTFTVTGEGTATFDSLPPADTLHVAAGSTLAISGDIASGTAGVHSEATGNVLPNDASDATKANNYLLHRWNFNNNASDLIGNHHATFVGNVTFIDGKQARLEGGERGTSWIDCGSNIIPAELGNTPFTIELWTTPRRLVNWAQAFAFGNSNKPDGGAGAGVTGLIFTYQCGAGPNYPSFSMVDEDGVNYQIGSDKLVVDTEYHIAAVVTPLGETSASVKIYIFNAGSATPMATIEKTTTKWSTATIVQDTFWLGHSWWPDEDPAANFNEVRVWNAALSADQLAENDVLGPDSLPLLTDEAFSAFTGCIDVAEGATVDLRGNTLTHGAVSGDGEVKNGNLNIATALIPGGKGKVGTLTLTANTKVNGEIQLDVGDLINVDGTLDLSAAKVVVDDPAQLGAPYVFATSTAGTITGKPNGAALPRGFQVVVAEDGTFARITRVGLTVFIK